MSNPRSPLSKYNVYSAVHILLAFDNTTAAATYEAPKDKPIGKVGEELANVSCGKGYVVVNEQIDFKYAIPQLEWSFDFFSPMTPNTTISGGSFVVSDATGDQFPSFLRKIAKKLNVAETKITFVLLTKFVRNAVVRDQDDVLPLKPLIFTLVDSSAGFREGMANMFSYAFTMLYNTTAQMPLSNGLNQFTVTNSENSPARSVPTTSMTGLGIMSRAEEDRLKNSLRDTRLAKSRPMRTLKELFAGLESELKEMRFAHKAQLQEFSAIIRPGSLKKIKTPKPKRAKAGEGLAMDYKVILDPKFADYPVNNRNLMTEQVEISQKSAGISSITIPPGATIYDAVDILMKTSTDVGKDAMNGYGYKTSISAVYDCEGVMSHTVHIKRYRIPRNKQDVVDTGNGAESKVNRSVDGKIEPITLEFNYMDMKDVDVMSVTLASSTSTDAIIMEEDADDFRDDAAFSSSQREAVTFERSDTDNFMLSGFAGLRAPADPINSGSESAIYASYVDTLRHRFTLAQNTLTNVTILGNSDLYSDLARNPIRVSQTDKDSPALFKHPEFFPMYVKLKIRIGKRDTEGKDSTVTHWYHTYHYHLSGVTNSIVGGAFTQRLRLLSTDDTI